MEELSILFHFHFYIVDESVTATKRINQIERRNWIDMMTSLYIMREFEFVFPDHSIPKNKQSILYNIDHFVF